MSNYWFCLECGELLDGKDIYPYCGDFIHVVFTTVDDGRGGYYPGPSPCGPVVPCTPVEQKLEDVEEVMK